VLAVAERDYLTGLAAGFSNLSAAARAAGLDRKHLRHRLRAHGLRAGGVPGSLGGEVAVVPELGGWGLAARAVGREAPPAAARLILDLCGGSGAWSEPYRRAGYRVEVVTLPAADVRVFVPPPAGVWGILAAPPCNEFSRARRLPGNHVAGLEVVAACLRVILQAVPVWWALENPWHGDLSAYLGPPDWTFHPWQFGDMWTKPTALWGEFTPPSSVGCQRPAGPLPSAMDRGNAAARAVTPPGFAEAFARANP
jgi:hypothetical protein